MSFNKKNVQVKKKTLRKKYSVTREAAVRLMQLQAKNQRGLMATSRSNKEAKNIVLILRENME